MKRIATEDIRSKPEYYAHLTQSNWSPIIQPSGTGANYWPKLFQYFPEYQLFFEAENGEWLGFANTLPVRYEGHLQDLPEEGWDWLLETGITGREKGLSPNLLGGLQIGVNPDFRGQGWSKRILEKAKSLFSRQGLNGFILPIRPTLKELYPEVSMEEYMTWKKDGRIFDPWIRTHLNAGARIIKVCHRAMVVEGSIQEWEGWTECHFENSGNYAIEGGLSLVEIDLSNDKGLYQEPNIWIYYAGV